mmetsp:Transcript_52794/g.150489  ORF Transcript_52794/g.150489 Transcript_52794/m.150489 type:complete len:795 (+) Transcript_52794:17-2401(+)
MSTVFCLDQCLRFHKHQNNGTKYAVDQDSKERDVGNEAALHLPEPEKQAEVKESKLTDPVDSGDLESDGPLSPDGCRRTCSDSLASGDSDEDHIWVANYAKDKCLISTFIPPLAWLPPYVRCVLGKGSQEDLDGAGSLPYSLKGDAIAGLTVGFMLVPQSLAFAMLAGLPVQTGLYASFLPLLTYAGFGTIRQVQPGPTALMSLLTGQALDGFQFVTEEQRMQGAALLALVVGGISLLLGLVRFGFIIDFMSHSVMTAFCSAAGITIGTSQLKHMLGIDMPRKKYWWKTVVYLVTHLGKVDVPTVVLGFTLLGLLVALKAWKQAGSTARRLEHPIWRMLPAHKDRVSFRVLKIVADMSSLLSVLVGWIWGFIYHQVGVDSVKLIGDVEGGGFYFILPGAGGGLSGLAIDSLFMSAAIMAVVGFLETMAVGGKFAAQNRYSYNPNQELLALGLSNVAGAFMSGYPGTGSFSRTAVNATFGATSLVATAMSSILVFLAVVLLLPIVAKLPLAALAPIIIQGAIGVIDAHHFKVAFKANRAEFVVMLSTLVVSLALSVKEGLLVGFVFSVLKTMYDLGNPNLAVCGRLPDGHFRDIRNFPRAEVLDGAVVVRMDARLSFANARKLKEFALRAVQVRETQGEKIDFVVVDAKSINHVDLTGLETLEVLAESLCSRGQRMILANLKGPVSKCLATAGVPESLKKHNGHLCIDMDQAVTIIRGGCPRKASEDLRELVNRVDQASSTLKAKQTKPFPCSSPTVAVSKTDRGSYSANSFGMRDGTGSGRLGGGLDTKSNGSA